MGKIGTNASDATWQDLLNEIQIWFKGMWEIRKEKNFFYVEFWNMKQNSRSERADLALMSGDFDLHMRRLVLTEINLKWFLLKKIIQVLNSIPWVRCASGNVFPSFCTGWQNLRIAQPAVAERSGFSLKGRTPIIRYFVAIKFFFCNLRAFWMAFGELTKKVIMLWKNIQWKPTKRPLTQLYTV